MMNRIRDLRQVICFINCQNQGASRSIAQWAPIRALPLTQGSLIVSDPLLNCTSFQNQICPWVVNQRFIFERIQQKSQILHTWCLQNTSFLVWSYWPGFVIGTLSSTEVRICIQILDSEYYFLYRSTYQQNVKCKLGSCCNIHTKGI